MCEANLSVPRDRSDSSALGPLQRKAIITMHAVLEDILKDCSGSMTKWGGKEWERLTSVPQDSAQTCQP